MSAAFSLCLCWPIVVAPYGPTRQSCAAARPEELGNWTSSENLRLSSQIVYGSDCQMTSRGSNLDSNLNSAAWPTGCKGFICSKIPEKSVWSLKFFLGTLKTPKLRTGLSWYQLSSTRLFPKVWFSSFLPQREVNFKFFSSLERTAQVASCFESSLYLLSPALIQKVRDMIQEQLLNEWIMISMFCLPHVARLSSVKRPDVIIT